MSRLEHNLDDLESSHRELTKKIIGVFYDVYNELGYGFLESVYQRAMELVLQRSGLSISPQHKLPVSFQGEVVGEFFADLLVEGKVILELKAVREIDSSHEAQLLNYLKASPIEIGLLLNFGPKPQLKRMIFDNPRKQLR